MGKEKKESEFHLIEVAYKINCISNIDSIKSTFEVDIKIFVYVKPYSFYCISNTNEYNMSAFTYSYWKDKKLIGRKKGSAVHLETEEGLFNPDITYPPLLFLLPLRTEGE